MDRRGFRPILGFPSAESRGRLALPVCKVRATWGWGMRMAMGLLAALGMALGAAPAQALAPKTGQPASLVLGQPNFTTTSSGLSAAGAGQTISVAVDPTSGKVFAVDSTNSRVLRFAGGAALVNGAAAEGVLGQTDFSFSGAGTGERKLDGITGICVDLAGRLWVADSANNRVLRFDNAANKRSGAAADGVLGQTDFSSGSPGNGANKFTDPTAVFVDAFGRLWVADTGNQRILRFDNAAWLRNGAPANGVLGQPDFVITTPGLSAFKMNAPSAVFVDGSARLWVADSGNQRVVRFDQAEGKGNGAAANGVLGQPDFTTNTPGLSQVTMSAPVGVTGDEDGRLYVSEARDSRVIWFDDAASKLNGAAADGVLGQANFTSKAAGANGESLSALIGQISYDAAGDALWVADGGNNRVLRFTEPPQSFYFPVVGN
jgi:DNA-binding beta-propeller fold protein YncE